MTETSPFIFDGPLPPDEVADREDEIATIADRAAHGRFVLLRAPRRYGKTSLIGRLAADMATTKHIAVVRVDLEGVLTFDDLARRLHDGFRSQLPKSPFGKAIRSAVDALAAVGFRAGKSGVSFEPRAAHEATPIVERLLDLPFDIGRKTGTRVLVVLDEFQAIGEVPNADAVLRSRIQHQREHVSYLFSGSEQGVLRTIFADKARPLYGQAEQIRLGPLPPDVAATFITERFERTSRSVGEALTPLLALAAGHPQRLAFLADALWHHTPRRGEADLSDWDAALSRALTDTDDEFQAIDAGLTPVQRKMVRVLAADEPPTGAFAERIGLSKGGARGALTALIERGIAQKVDGHTHLVDPLYAEWTRRRR